MPDKGIEMFVANAVRTFFLLLRNCRTKKLSAIQHHPKQQQDSFPKTDIPNLASASLR
jgi:hypothetical protein